MRDRIAPALPAFTASGLMIEKVRSVTIRSSSCYFFLSSFATAAPMSAGDFTTWMPAASIAFIFSAAVPLPPEMIAPGVAHAPARRRRLAGDEADDRLLHVRLHERGRLLLGAAADLADHHDRLGARVVVEQLERVGVVGADDRVAADADAGDWPMPSAVSWPTAS